MNSLRILNNTCQQSILWDNKLNFEFREFYIEALLELKIDEKKREYYACGLQHYKDKFEELLKENFVIKEVIICSYELLNNREEDESFISISNSLYRTIIQLKSFDNQIISSYSLSLDYGDSEFCPAIPIYKFEIIIDKEFIKNIDFVHFLINSLINDSSKPSNFYIHNFKENKKIYDSKKIKIVNTNTKVRRLGYLILLAEFFNKNKKVAANYINKKFEKFVKPYNLDLIKYKNAKGLIKETVTGTSAKPYIMLAKEFNLLLSLNNIYTSGKLFKVYCIIKQQLNDKSNEAFCLTNIDKLFFLETILKNDFFYLSVLIEQIYIQMDTSYLEISNSFQKALLNRLNEYKVGLIAEQNSRNLFKLIELYDRINKWSKPEVYLEHIIMPRLNWLLDLDIIEMQETQSIRLTNYGKKLFEHLCFWNDLNYERIVSPDEFINLFIINMFDDIYNKQTKKIEDDGIIYNYIDKFILESFQHFKTLAPNRVTASQAIHYTKYKMYFIHNIIVEFSFIENYLSNNKLSNFIYKFQQRYGDGYIQLKGK
jgi:hypothetical protein